MASPPRTFRAERDGTGDGQVLYLRGALRLEDLAELHRVLDPPVPVVDLTGLDHLDGGGAAMLQAHVMLAHQNGTAVELRGSDGGVARLLELYACPDGVSCLKPAPRVEGVLAQTGRSTVMVAHHLLAVLGFVGQFTLAVGATVRRPRSVPWADLPPLMNRAGADGLPIVVVVNFLLGFTIALSGAGILARYGGNVFVAELVGFSIVRELGPLMTAILVAGRSGAAYSAELGTMQVGEEVDALRTMSLEPVRYLVLPRIAALLLVVPMLTMVANVIAIAGGGVVALTSLDLTTSTYLGRLQDSLDTGDLFFGLGKSAVFALAIALVACQRGLATRGGAEGVGQSTTSAVVVALFLLVAINAMFSGLAQVFGW